MNRPGERDRRVARTHRLLRDALVALILERGWDKVSVRDVCDRADVGRSTFYAHFADKEDLLVSGLGDLRRALREWARASAREGPFSFARGLIEHVHEQRRLFRAVVGKHSGYVVQQRFRQMLVDVVREDLAELPVSGPRLEAAAHYLAGALFELVIWWLETRTPLQAAELDALFHELSAPVLTALRRARGSGRHPP